ncbi:MAG: glycosyltransferase family 2 protein [Acidimicrobiia bacterium]
MRTHILIPAYNEAATIVDVIHELRATLDDIEILVVSDGSKDATASLAREAGAIVVELIENRGTGGALQEGFRWGAAHGVQRMVQVDGDGQHEASGIQFLTDGLDAGADLVIGSRFAPGGSTTYPVSVIRRGAQRFLGLLVRRLSGRRFTDTSSGFRGFARPAIEFFANDYPNAFLSDTVEALIRACKSGLDVREVGVSMRPRAGGAPSHNTFRMTKAYLHLVRRLLTWS